MWQLGVLALVLVAVALNWVGWWEPITDWIIGVFDRLVRPDAASATLSYRSPRLSGAPTRMSHPSPKLR